MEVEFTKEQKVNDKLYKIGEEANFSKSVALEFIAKNIAKESKPKIEKKKNDSKSATI